MNDNCALCALDTTAAATVYRDELWSCDVPPGPAAPGWFQLRLRRHCESWGDLSDEEAAAYGIVFRDVSKALVAATGAPRIYTMSFGENHAHLHALVIARPAELAPDQRGMAFLPLRDALIDTPEALALAARIAARIAGVED